jgi:hypothetical protein
MNSEKNMYDMLSEIYSESDGSLSDVGKKNIEEILGKKSTPSRLKPDMSVFKETFDKLLWPFMKIDSFLFKDPPKMTNAYNKRGSWF